jgi:phosphoserine aminotransferase
MISFYPGPSRVYKKIPAYVNDAYDEGILSINHRSEEFVNLCAETQRVLRKKLKIPADYMIFFTSSATECWEIIAQSLPETISYHFYNGAFGEKWFRYTQKLKKKTIGYHFINDKPLNTSTFDLSGEKGLICLTQNETSNGTQISFDLIKSLRKKYPDHLLALDVTSSLGGISIPITQGDIWYASVQKCFGLPAGLGIMICSPGAIERVLHQQENNHYNSLLFMREMMKDYQTTYTPNVLAIYLLKRTQEANKNINKIHDKTIKRAKDWYKLMEKLNVAAPLIKAKSVRSDTVITCTATPDQVSIIKKEAAGQGLLLGNGYGKWKEDTFRIANFPAIKGKEVKQLQEFFKSFS